MDNLSKYEFKYEWDFDSIVKHVRQHGQDEDG